MVYSNKNIWPDEEGCYGINNDLGYCLYICKTIKECKDELSEYSINYPLSRVKITEPLNFGQDNNVKKIIQENNSSPYGKEVFITKIQNKYIVNNKINVLEVEEEECVYSKEIRIYINKTPELIYNTAKSYFDDEFSIDRYFEI